MTTSGKRGRRGGGSARKRGDRWEFRFRIGGSQHSVYGQTLTEARAKADGARCERQEQFARSPMVRDWIADWLALRRSSWRSQTWLAYNMYARCHIVPAIGDVRVDSLTPEHVEQLHATMLRTVSPTTTHHAHGVLASALRSAA